ncbi:MAG: ABC transporter permease, partial [Pseudorhodoplanes sp.]
LPQSYVHAFLRSLFIATSAAVLATVIGTAAAVSLARSSLGRSHLLQTLFQLPLQIPFVVIGVVFLQFYYALLDLFDIQLISTYTGLIIAHLFFCIPYSVGTVGAVITPELRNIENAARICGAPEARVFRRITIPALMPGVFSGFFYAVIMSFGDIPVSIFLTRANLQTLPVQIFQTLQFDFDPAVLSASTLVIVFSVALIAVVRQVLGIDLVLRASKK